MQIILQHDVPSLGDAGSVVRVRDGYARNFLIPQQLAVVANPDNLKQLEHHQRVVASKQAKLKGEATDLGKKLKGIKVEFTREAGEGGKLFGSVTTSEIAAELASQGVEVDRRRVRLAQPIKAVGDFKADVRLHSEVHVEIKITVNAATEQE